jgi:hypothetical protein
VRKTSIKTGYGKIYILRFKILRHKIKRPLATAITEQQRRGG